MIPTSAPTADPTTDPSVDPTADPTADPTTDPTKEPTGNPTAGPTAPDCYPQNVCDYGYMDQTNGNSNNWSCGSACEGGQYRTDDGCNCACIPASTCDPTNSPTMIPTKSPTRDFSVFLTPLSTQDDVTVVTSSATITSSTSWYKDDDTNAEWYVT